MLDFPKWKVWAIVLTLVTGVLLAIPSLIPEATAKQLGIGAAPRINLGLDLSGGSHLLLEAETGDVAKQRLDLMEDAVRTELRRATPEIEIGDIATTDGALSFFVRNPTQVDAAVEKVRALTSPVGVTGQRDFDVRVVDSMRVTMTPTAAGLNAAVESAMQVATEVVRRRIDELGTREPTIIRQGADRIIVQVPGLQDPQALKNLLGKTAKLEFKLVDLTADPAEARRNAIGRGERLFNQRQFTINNVGGLTDGLPGNQLRGTCSTCHDTPNAGNRSLPDFLDIGLSDPNPPGLNVGYLPQFRLECTSGPLAGRQIATTDPGRALVTGNCVDISRFKVPSLRGLAARAPYFHNGAADNLGQVVGFYDRRFRIGLNPQDRDDLIAFLEAL